MNTQYCPSFHGELHSDVNVCPHLSHKWPPMQNMSRNFPYHCTWRIFQTKISSEVLHLEIMSNKKNFCRYFAYVSEFIIYTNIPATLRIAYIARENACIKTGGNLCIFFCFESQTIETDLISKIIGAGNSNSIWITMERTSWFFIRGKRKLMLIFLLLWKIL